MKIFEITTVISIDEQTVEDLLICAFEGGSNYWYSSLETLSATSIQANASSRFYENLMNHGFSLMNGKDEIKVYPAAFQLALSQLSVDFKTHFDEIVLGNFDAGTADVFLQLCCFGKVIYG